MLRLSFCTFKQQKQINKKISTYTHIEDMCAETIKKKKLSSSRFLAFFATAFKHLKEKRKASFPLVTSSLL